jgi:hypothetical protein
MPGVSQFVNPCIAVRLAQLLSVKAADERMMEEHGGSVRPRSLAS